MRIDRYLPGRFVIKDTVRQCFQCVWSIIVTIIITMVDVVVKCAFLLILHMIKHQICLLQTFEAVL